MFTILKWVKKLFIVFIVILFLIFLLSRGHVFKPDELEYGLTFSKKQATDLGFDWQKVYLAILDDLGVRKIRLPAYWDEIEPTNGQFNWQNLDWQIEQASKRNSEIILAIGGRLPRWPECHFPSWTGELNKAGRDKKILAYLTKTVNRYKNNKNIIAWQIENEPFLSHFGDCPKLDKELLDSEINLTRSLDSRPIIITDSGELSTWVPAAKRADIFGTTMYLNTYSQFFKRYIHYPITPGFFRFKKNITQMFAQPQDWIVIELQAEPWGSAPYQNLSQADRDRTMDLNKFREIIKFSAKTGFKEFYLWGAEWWYWEREVNNNPALWEEAKRLFK